MEKRNYPYLYGKLVQSLKHLEILVDVKIGHNKKDVLKEIGKILKEHNQ